MGRNILWREIVVKSFFNKLLAALFIQLFVFDLYAKVEDVRLATDERVKATHIFTHASIRGFILEFTDHAVVRRFRDQFSTERGRKYLETTMKRSSPYRQFIEEQLKNEKMPKELLFLPVIESGYQPKAVSRAGAVGIWQFMPNSVGGYDIHIDEWIDERQDPWKASVAAIKKLKWNYRYYDDWCLALAAYNCGVGSLNKAIKKAGKKDYWYLADNDYLPKETKFYVPKFLAVSDILTNSEENGIDWGESDALGETDVVEVTQPIDLSLLAAELGVQPNVLSSLNPSLKFNITPPNLKYTLRVPSTQCEATRDVLSKKKLLLKYYRYKIRSGDNLSSLANHYGVSIKTIMKYNAAIKNSHSLKVGQEVLIPAVKHVTQYKANNSAKTSSKVSSVAKQRESDGKVARNVAKNLKFVARYTVKKGDSLWSIATKFKISVDLLAKANGIKVNETLSLGRVLKVPSH